MIISNPLEQKSDRVDIVKTRLETLGKQEIYLWKELVKRDETLFAEIYQLIYSENPRIAWHAAWVIDHVSEEDPAKLKPYVPELIDRLPSLKSSSLRRHFTRMLLSQEIPEHLLGTLVDVLYNLLSPEEAVAVRANSLQLLYNISMIEPDLKPELISVIEGILEEELTPGMKSKGRNLLKGLRR